MPPIAAARPGQNIRRTYCLMNDITSPGAACDTEKGLHTTMPSHPKNAKLYKTELCRTWMDSGRCNYGDKCQYAHGEQERRPVSRHPKYKTEFCQPFHQVGYCPYGPRCNFIHNEEQPLPLLRTRRAQYTFSGDGKITGVSSSNGTASTTSSPLTTTATATALTFGMWEPYCGSAGDSPAPSSADSSSDSPVGSTSPSVDFDESIGSVIVSSNWTTFGGKLSNNLCRFKWPARTARTTPLITQPSLDSALINDLLELTIDKKVVITKPAKENVTSDASGNSSRLPVFTQLSNPSSAS